MLPKRKTTGLPDDRACCAEGTRGFDSTSAGATLRIGLVNMFTTCRRSVFALSAVIHSRSWIDVIVRVRDDGNGFARGWKEGTGLGSLRERLAFLYGGRAALTVRSDPGGDVAMTVPIRHEA